tara:strand:+ start:4378 stop:4839 length:462 start_codon:yes stop_codon:yes gene_type:complete
MSKEKEYSAIDAIYKILDKLDFLEKKISVLDSNIKIINNKLSKNNLPPARADRTASPSPATGVDSDMDIDKLIVGNIKTFGYIVNSSMVPIHGVSVEILDSGEVIKKTHTDGEGHWSVRLPPGDYSVRYSHDNFENIIKKISLSNEMKKYEVV